MGSVDHVVGPFAAAERDHPIWVLLVEHLLVSDWARLASVPFPFRWVDARGDVS
jgi:hypothetical protein